jgi:hypothetical protein
MIANIKHPILIFLLFVACAHQIPPGGGPDDKTPPAVSYTVPLRGAVGVSTTNAIVLVFSEWIQQQNVDKCVIMFPPPPAGIQVSVSGKKLTIKPRRALADSTTYHLSLNTSMQDLHGNSIGTPYDLFFSTGPTIDSGRVSGCVISQDGKLSQPKVALFPSARADSSDTVFFGMPSYLTQTDSGGTFSFDNIHRGTYDCIAFSDDNNNNKCDPGREQVYAPVKKHFVLDRVVGPLSLYPIVCDTTTMHIVTLKPVSPVCMFGEWAGGSTLPPPVWDKSWCIASIERSRTVPIAEYVPVAGSRRFYLKLGDTLGLAPFKLIAGVISPLHAAAAVRQRDTIRFNGVSASDTTAPIAKGSEPQGVADLKPAIKLTWSKPVAAHFTKWYCVDSLEDSTLLSVTPGLSDTTFFSLGRALAPDMKYTIKFPDSAFSDICGNHPKDTAGIKIGFRTMSGQEICFSLSGGVPCLKPDSQRTWLFMPVGGVKRYPAKDKSGQFRFDSIPAGKGTMGIFTDVNHDNRMTMGSLVPWTPPEPFRIFPDTIEARKNWDIEGVTLTGACEECVKKKSAPKKAEPAKTK